MRFLLPLLGMRSLRLLLLPFSILYGLVLKLRHFFFNRGWAASTSFSLPTLVVGNLLVGGTGKSPMILYLVGLLKDNYKLAVLSRGYGRKTHGYRTVSESDKASLTGDEPLQLKKQFPEITVAVDADRVNAIRRLMLDHELVLLDDGFQHRALRPGFSILMFDYQRIYGARWLLPAGDYRDTFNRAGQANLIVVSKCPENLSIGEQAQIRRRFQGTAGLKIFFSTLIYGELTPLREDIQPMQLHLELNVLLVSGIANPAPLEAYISKQVAHVRHLAYRDHHRFGRIEAARINKAFGEMNEPKAILTTEKDAVRLLELSESVALPLHSIYLVPVNMRFLGNNSAEDFNKEVLTYIQHNKS